MTGPAVLAFLLLLARSLFGPSQSPGIATLSAIKDAKGRVQLYFRSPYGFETRCTGLACPFFVPTSKDV